MIVYIITIFDNQNLGNRLQNYAMVKVLEKICLEMGISPHIQTIDIECQKRIKNCVKYVFHRITGFRLCRSTSMEWWEQWARTSLCASTKKFNRQYIKSKKIGNIRSLKRLTGNVFIFGSDQIWNTVWLESNQLKQEAFLGTFTEGRKVAVSASIGVEELPAQWNERFSRALKKFVAISVRENAGAQIVKKLTGITPPLLIDPTLMLEKSEWREVSRCPEWMDVGIDYILSYFLGEFPENMNDDIRSVKLKMGLWNGDCKVIDINGVLRKSIGPAEFLWLVDHAKIVLTDSFHACAFSFIFARPFKVYERTGEIDMLCRLDTFLNEFGLNRKSDWSKETNDILEADYSAETEHLKEKRAELKKYIMKALFSDGLGGGGSL